jgi:hypothetical protein
MLGEGPWAIYRVIRLGDWPLRGTRMMTSGKCELSDTLKKLSLWEFVFSNSLTFMYLLAFIGVYFTFLI